MKPFLFLLMLAGLPSGAVAKPLEKKDGRAYSHLWNHSPFTKRREVIKEPAKDPFEHYSLAGVAPIPGGYRINLLDRRAPGTSIVLSDRPEFKVVNVQYSAGNPLNTSVRLALQGQEGVVTFDPALLKDHSNRANSTPAPTPNPSVQSPIRQPRARSIESTNGAARPH